MFGLVKEIRLKELQKEYAELSLRIKYAEDKERENSTLKSELVLVNDKIIELKKQIREQTEADLFFTSAKIQKKLLDGEPKENVQSLGVLQLGYQQQLLAAQQQSYSPFNLLGGLGSLFRR